MKLMTLVLAAVLTFGASAEEVDLQKSQFKWKGTKVTGEHYGTVKLKSASVTTNEGNLTGGEFVIDLSTIDCEDLSGEWKDKFLGHIKNEDFFDIAKYPTAKLKINSVKDGKIMGDMTIKGKTNAVTIPYKQKGKEFTGEFTFDRTKFDMIYGSGDFFKNLGDKVIHNDVKVSFNVHLK